MANLLSAPYSYFADANGAPLSGGQIQTYAAGTTNPKATYTDSTLITPLPNPVILDSAGRAAIWLSGNYKIVVMDSLDNTIRTADNVSSATATGDMTKAVYDAANISEQLVGLIAVQTLSNKTLTAPNINNGTINQPNIVGVTGASNAAAGSVGEYISSTQGTPQALTSGTAINVTSISLTAGDWDVWINTAFNFAASTSVTIMQASISTTSATQNFAAGNYGAIVTAAQVVGSAQNPTIMAQTRISIASTTTIYMVAGATFTVSTANALGAIQARRIR